MIRTLQKRFVITAMIAITVLLLILLGAINVANVMMGQNGIRERIEIIANTEGNPQKLDGTHKEPPDFAMKPKDEHDMMLSSTFFVARYNSGGSMVYLDASHIASLSEDEVKELADTALSGRKSNGRTGRFYYTIKESNRGNGTVVVFLDTTDEFYTCIRVLFLSAGVGILCWGLMLAFVILLSKKAIRPIAENMEKQKQFVTNAGHEIKTPLAIIQANTDAMELYQGETKWSKNIKTQTQRLSGLMKNLLLLAKMDEADIAINLSLFSFSDLAQDMAESFQEPMRMQEINLQTQIQPDIHIEADKEQIMQLLSILLDNARKYAKNGSEIDLELRKEKGRVCLSVSNVCEKLPQVPAERLFDRFYRADEARTQKNGGYGIGLSVARGIVNANKGKIKASYNLPDKVTFIVKF